MLREEAAGSIPTGAILLTQNANVNAFAQFRNKNPILRQLREMERYSDIAQEAPGSLPTSVVMEKQNALMAQSASKNTFPIFRGDANLPRFAALKRKPHH